MNSFFIVLAALATVVSARHPLAWRIVGGQTADDGQFPYQVSLRNYGFPSCGGAIINERWIITAAQCVAGGDATYMTVMAGSNQLNSTEGIYQVEKIVYHPEFDGSNLQNDIALVKVSSSISFNAKVQAIELGREEIGDGETVVLSGWGSNSYPEGEMFLNLQFLNLLSILSSDCHQRHQSTGIPVYEDQLCTFTKSGEGVCMGDSGSPLAHNGKLAGIASWGRPCAVGYPDVFTRVSSYIGWIDESIQ